MFAVLLLGLLLGMQHALEADHVAAVASLATRNRSVGATVRQGAVWGLGHALTLLLFGGAVLLLDGLVPDRLARMLELAVGLMLITLGLEVLWRLLRDKVHFHLHRHQQRVHLHAHTHRNGVDHALDPHQHQHPQGFPVRALVIGMMHGMAGSAALIILVLKTVISPLQGLLYILLFGLGSVIGMALLAAAISLPLRYSAHTFTWAHKGLKALVGLLTVGTGSLLIYQHWMTIGL